VFVRVGHVFRVCRLRLPLHAATLLVASMGGIRREVVALAPRILLAFCERRLAAACTGLAALLARRNRHIAEHRRWSWWQRHSRRRAGERRGDDAEAATGFRRTRMLGGTLHILQLLGVRRPLQTSALCVARRGCI